MVRDSGGDGRVGAFALSGDIGFVAQLANFTIFVVFIVVNGAVIRLRISRPHAPRPFSAPGRVRGMPVASLIGGVAAGALLLTMSPGALLSGLALAAAGLALSTFAMNHEVERETPRSD